MKTIEFRSQVESGTVLLMLKKRSEIGVGSIVHK